MLLGENLGHIELLCLNDFKIYSHLDLHGKSVAEIKEIEDENLYAVATSGGLVIIKIEEDKVISVVNEFI